MFPFTLILTNHTICRTTNNMNLYLLTFSYLCYIVHLSLSKEVNKFWLWKGSCVKCKSLKMAMKVFFCENFGNSFGKFPFYQNMWKGSATKHTNPHKSEQIHIKHLLDEDGNHIYNCPLDEWRHRDGMGGAQFWETFQCDICIFRSMFKRDPMKSNKMRNTYKLLEAWSYIQSGQESHPSSQQTSNP